MQPAKFVVIGLCFSAGAAHADACGDLRTEFLNQFQNKPKNVVCDVELYAGHAPECLAYYERQNVAVRRLIDAGCSNSGKFTWNETLSTNLDTIETMRKYPDGAFRAILDEADRARQATIDSLTADKRRERDEREAREAAQRALRDTRPK